MPSSNSRVVRLLLLVADLQSPQRHPQPVPQVGGHLWTLPLHGSCKRSRYALPRCPGWSVNGGVAVATGLQANSTPRKWAADSAFESGKARLKRPWRVNWLSTPTESCSKYIDTTCK
eukprot:365238-Chlamydomonas_euryale.AAC.4